MVSLFWVLIFEQFCCTFSGLVCVYVLKKHFLKFCFNIRVPPVRSSTLPSLPFSSSIQSHKGLYPL